jgi:hypothetical protein
MAGGRRRASRPPRGRRRCSRPVSASRVNSVGDTRPVAADERDAGLARRGQKKRLDSQACSDHRSAAAVAGEASPSSPSSPARARRSADRELHAGDPGAGRTQPCYRAEAPRTRPGTVSRLTRLAASSAPLPHTTMSKQAHRGRRRTRRLHAHRGSSRRVACRRRRRTSPGSSSPLRRLLDLGAARRGGAAVSSTIAPAGGGRRAPAVGPASRGARSPSASPRSWSLASARIAQVRKVRVWSRRRTAGLLGAGTGCPGEEPIPRRVAAGSFCTRFEPQLLGKTEPALERAAAPRALRSKPGPLTRARPSRALPRRPAVAARRATAAPARTAIGDRRLLAYPAASQA